MRRLSRRLFARTRLNAMTRLLVGACLATSAVTAQALTLLSPGTTVWTSGDYLMQGDLVKVLAGQTLVLDARESGMFILDADLHNKGVVQVIGSNKPPDWIYEPDLFSAGIFENEGTLELKQAKAWFFPLVNDSGLVRIDAQSKLWTVFDPLSGRVHGEELTSEIQAYEIHNATLAGRLTLIQSAIKGTTTIEGLVHMPGVSVRNQATLQGLGQTVLRGVNGRNEHGAPIAGTPAQLTIAAGHRVDAAGQFTDVLLVNQGQIEVAAQQTLAVDRAVQQQGPEANLVVHGTLQAPQLQLNGGVVDVHGQIASQVTVDGGKLVMHEGGVVKGDVDVRSGRLSVYASSVDALALWEKPAFDGNLMLSDNAEFEVIVTSGIDFIDLGATGLTRLGGKLILTFAEGVRPVSHDFFVLFFDIGRGMQGTFNSLEVRGRGNLPWHIADQSGGWVALSSVPEPGTWGLMLCGLGVVGWRLRRRAPAQATH